MSQQQSSKEITTSHSAVQEKGAVVVAWLLHTQLFCNAVDCVLPGSSVQGILQARILEWVAISFSRGSSQPSGLTHISCIGKQILHH